MIEVPLEPAPPEVRGHFNVLLRLNLDAERRAALNDVAEHLGLPSRAAAIRQASRLVLEAAEAGASLKGHVRMLDRRRTGEGVYFDTDEAEALAAAAKRLGVTRGAALRWGCDALIDACQGESRNGSH